MCGRYNIGAEVKIPDLEDIIAEAQRNLDKETKEKLKTEGLIRPTDIVPTLTASGPQAMKWGLRLFGRDPLINSRSDKLFQLSTYREIVTSGKRCLIPMCWYYERDKEKTDFIFYENINTLMYAAGIYMPSEDGIPRCSIITTNALPPIESIHDRMPLILPIKIRDEWVKPQRNVQALLTEGIKKIEWKRDPSVPEQMSLF